MKRPSLYMLCTNSEWAVWFRFIFAFYIHIPYPITSKTGLFESRLTFLLQRTIAIHVLLGAFAKLQKATSSLVMYVRLSVRPHGATRLPLDGFSLSLIFEYFSKICWENSSLIKTNKNNGHFTWRSVNIYDRYVAEFVLNEKRVRQK
jgi:hypothetical protein